MKWVDVPFLANANATPHPQISCHRQRNKQIDTPKPERMKSLGEIEEDLAEKAEPILGIKPSSKFKRGPIGILIYVVCGIVAFISLRSAGVF